VRTAMASGHSDVVPANRLLAMLAAIRLSEVK
jgi:hypothetical protein